jgi:hypothetical protein
LLAYFPKMKQGLSNNQSLFVWVCVHANNLSLLIDLDENLYGGDAIVGDLVSINFSPMALTI